MLKLFGLLDLLAAMSFTALLMGLGKGIALFFACYLLIKSIVFIKDLSSMVDIAAAVSMLLVVAGVEHRFAWLFVLWLFQKGFFSVI